MKKHTPHNLLSLTATLNLNAEYTHRSLASTGDYIPWIIVLSPFYSYKRTKRGLFKLGSLILSELFGVAVEADTQHIQGAIGTLE